MYILEQIGRDQIFSTYRRYPRLRKQPSNKLYPHAESSTAKSTRFIFYQQSERGTQEVKPGLEGRKRGVDGGGGGGGGGGGIFEQQRASMFEIIGDVLSDQSPDPRLGLCLLRFCFFVFFYLR